MKMLTRFKNKKWNKTSDYVGKAVLEKMRQIQTPAALKTTISELLDKTLRPNNAPINETYGSTS